MPKERRVLSVPSNRTRVSPYPLRSSRTKKETEEPVSPLQTEGPSQWEDVRCVICQEPPHNAVLLRCSSSSTGCRAYMCDTSARHSNCFKQYRAKNRNRLTKAFKCPYCRGEVHETMKVSGAVRYLNAKPRSCAFEGCAFSGSYSQLQNHLRAEHPGFSGPVVDQRRRRAWEQMRRDAEYSAVLTAAGMLPHNPALEYSFPSSAIEVNGVAHDSIPFNLPPNTVIRLNINGVEHDEFPHDLPPNPMIRISISGVVLNLSLGVR